MNLALPNRLAVTAAVHRASTASQAALAVSRWHQLTREVP
jgi:hypothetical protein